MLCLTPAPPSSYVAVFFITFTCDGLYCAIAFLAPSLFSCNSLISEQIALSLSINGSNIFIYMV